MPLEVGTSDDTSNGAVDTAHGPGNLETTLRTDLDKDDVLRDSGCFPDSRPEYPPSSFNNLSYEDFELKSRYVSFFKFRNNL